MPETVWTIGHSTRAWNDFVELLKAHGIRAIADVRRFPASRKHPQFNREEMEKALAAVNVEYAAYPDLGGRRPARPDSPNTAWRNASFRGYADYMATPAFHDALQRLLRLAGGKRTAMMCAEAVWWRCHRGLIADELKARGVEVLHIGDGGEPKPHPYTPAARVVQGRLSYAGEQGRLL
jgi:uncharacterized protein (DUF488 family)